jgi:phage-related protein
MPIVKDVFKFITEKILPPFLSIFEFIYTVIVPKFSEVFKKVMPSVGVILQDLWKIAKVVLSALVTDFQRVWPIIKSTVTIAMNIISPLIEGFFKLLSGLTTFIAGVFTADWAKAWEGVKTVFIGVFEGISGSMKGLINGILGAMNYMIDSLNKLKFSVPDWVPGMGGKTFSLNIAHIPTFAEGTNFAPGGMALVGERGPELVNLPRGSQVTPNNALGGIVINVGTLVGSGGMNEFVNIISNKLNKKYSAAIGGGFY